MSTTLAPAAKVNQPHTISKGTIIFNSWGYDQTNIDYYQVISTTDHFVMLQELKSVDWPDGPGTMTGKKSPIYGSAHGPIVKHKVKPAYDGGVYIKFQYGIGKVWDGKSKHYTCYA